MIRRHCPIRPLSPAGDGWQYWVGYYDIQPWSPAGDKLLCHRATFADRFPGVGETCEVGYLDLTAQSADGTHPFVRLADTLAWNWQQGAMLRWWEHDAEPALIFNGRADHDPRGEIRARVVSIDGAERRTVPGPVLALSPDRRWGLSLTMGRINSVRFEYGYAGERDPNPDDPAPDNDGVFRVDMQSGERTLIVPLSDLCITPTSEDVPNAPAEPFGYVNHIMFNRSGSRFCFVHRYERDDGIVQTRLFTSDIHGRDVRQLMSGMVSHYDWRDDATILAWAGFRKLLGGSASGPRRGPKAAAMTLARRTLKPVYYALGKPRFLMNRIVKDRYMLIPDEAGAGERGRTVDWASGELTCDGHCTYNRGGPNPNRFVVTDGYPDRGKQPLFLWDDSEDVGYEVGRYSCPARFDRETRVDLHPRFSRDARRLCIDSARDGDRRIYEVDVSSITTPTRDHDAGDDRRPERGAP
jgi:hypothetical protein